MTHEPTQESFITAPGFWSQHTHYKYFKTLSSQCQARLSLPNNSKNGTQLFTSTSGQTFCNEILEYFSLMTMWACGNGKEASLHHSAKDRCISWKPTSLISVLLLWLPFLGKCDTDQTVGCWPSCILHGEQSTCKFRSAFLTTENLSHSC